MSNELQVFRADSVEILDTDVVANLPIASKAGNQAIGSVAGNLYLTDSDGVSKSVFKSAPVDITANKTLTAEEHGGKTMLLDLAAGVTVIMPLATGSGLIYRFLVKTKATSNNHIVKVADASHTFSGIITTVSDDAGAPVKGYIAGASDDTITLNRSTTGSVSNGEWLELQDVATNLFSVRGVTSSSGTEATPFSSTV